MKTAKQKTKTLSEAFQKRNAAFLLATPEGKRVLIFKDMLAQLKTEKYKPKCGVWVEGIGKEWSKAEGQQICDVSEKLRCNVCQVGGVMLSTLRFVNDACIKLNIFSGDFIIDLGTREDKTKKYFEKSQIRLMELAYEKGKGCYSFLSVKKELGLKAIKFGKKYSSNYKRMVAICKNAVKNNGTFIP